jgi:glycosyltransferase involved in cell wall biosynthesis
MASHGLEHRFWEVFMAEERAGRLRISLKHRLFTRYARLTAVRAAVRVCDRLICLTASERDYIVRRGWKSSAQIEVIPNGVGPEYFEGRAALRSPLHRLVYLSPWTWNKGQRTIISGFTELARRRLDVELTLAGTGLPRELLLADFPAELHPRIATWERLSPSEVASELPRHHLFLFPSLFEGGPLSLLEAMAAGLAIITSNCYAMAEIITDGSDGLLIPSGDEWALVSAVELLLDNPRKTRQLGSAARTKARDMSWHASALRTLAVLSELAHDTKVSSPAPSSH